MNPFIGQIVHYLTTVNGVLVHRPAVVVLVYGPTSVALTVFQVPGDPGLAYHPTVTNDETATRAGSFHFIEA